MNPALTGYDRRVCYVTFDVTRDVHPGDNAVGVVLGNGRYFAPRRDIPVPMTTYGYPKLLLQIRLEYADGSVENVVSDADWRLTDDGPIRANNEFDGEEYDARREMPGWSLAGFDDSGWQSAAIVKPPGGTLEAQMIEPIRVTRSPQAGRPDQPPAGHLHGRLRPVVLRLGAAQGLRAGGDRGPDAHVVQRDARRPAQRRQRPQRQ